MLPLVLDLSGMPRVDRVLGRPELAGEREVLGTRLATALVRSAIDAARRDLSSGARTSIPSEDEIVSAVRARACRMRSSRARRVINATGVMLHTNLGRAPLSDRAAAAVAESMRGYSSIEIDLETGKRGRRAGFLEDALATVSGSEAALVVNNCAAAVLLLLSTVARDREVIVSRGELIEIGGGFRVPDVMAHSGARLVEVGTTNKTRTQDYERALEQHPNAVAILRVHQGNFRQLGFVERPSLGELGALAKSRGVLLLKDLGGGALVDLAPRGLSGEPTVADCLAAGCDALTFSTDKVLGGPQGGALVGRATLVQSARSHPLARALRLGRLPVVALEATVEAYLLERAWEEIPALAMVSAPVSALEARVDGWVAKLAASGICARRISSEAEMGGGTLAGRKIPSAALALDEVDPAVLARSLREGEPAVVGRVQDDALLLDARSVRPDEGDALIAAVMAASALAASALAAEPRGPRK